MSYIPHSSRSSLQISPTVHRARSASRIGGEICNELREEWGMYDTQRAHA